MALRQHMQAEFKRWQGPRYPKEMAALAKALDGSRLTRSELEEIAARLDGYVGPVDNCTTKDGYTWQTVLGFRWGGIQVRLAIPYLDDIMRKGGVRTDRSPALYYIGSINQNTAAEMVKGFIAALSLSAR